ncbi:hypothetical protein CURE108131_25030 [Cupriavidus respiraculi]|uniref:Uncharacterized protein n=1 Tax=Cupriavidus respiraculi TaxID=195930 RepID=A0ABN7ZJI4_9BURK|nr:hypothetical protein [Cupriavidus respiraculi]CAG9184197.1 hypothetical protein LMG21510_05037 [Cupriavidus respiraculi]
MNKLKRIKGWLAALTAAAVVAGAHAYAVHSDEQSAPPPPTYHA